ncbi:MAG: beta/gamma crystallin-related protein [Pseudolabrys sp.]|jgi:hypothetical protein
MSILIAALAVATQASPQAFAQTSKDAGVTTTLGAQQVKKNPPPVRAVSRPAPPVRSVSRPAPPVHSVSRPAPPTRSVVTSKPIRTVTQPPKTTIKTVTTPAKPPVVTTMKPTKPTTFTQGPGTKRTLTQGPGVTRDRLVRSNRGNLRDGITGQRRVVINRDRRRIFVNNRWRTLVPLVALGTFIVGAETLYADGYVSVPEPVCTGYAEDGSMLRWMAVPTEDGGTEYQCISYSAECNRTVTEIELPVEPVAEGPAPVAPPETVGVGPAREPVVAAPEPPPAPATGCELLIYSETNFKGLSAPVDEDQPTLGDNGWQNEIASLEIKSGTWDFYSDEQYGGDVMRLGAGSYATLDPKWAKHIGSFMCSTPNK